MEKENLDNSLGAEEKQRLLLSIVEAIEIVSSGPDPKLIISDLAAIYRLLIRIPVDN